MCHCGLLPIICHLFKLEEEEEEEEGGVYPSVPCVVHACLVIRIALPLPLPFSSPSLIRSGVTFHFRCRRSIDEDNQDDGRTE